MTSDSRRPTAIVALMALALILAALAGGAALVVRAQPASAFAELAVTAYGAQRFDLATGFTELPDGGEVVDQGSGVRLEAPWLRYAEGERLEATDALVHGPFGEVFAPGLTLDLGQRQLYADGGVRLSTPSGTVRAATLRFNANDGWILARHDVHSDMPALEAAGVWYEIDGGRLLLLPPYAYADGPITLRADAEGAPLQLTPEVADDGTLNGYDATTDLDDDLRSRVRAATEE